MEQTPDVLAHNRRMMAEDYEKYQKRIGEIQKAKASKIIMLLVEHKTISKAELYYNATDEGQELLELTYKCKGLLELMRACKTEIDIINSEQFGRF